MCYTVSIVFNSNLLFLFNIERADDIAPITRKRKVTYYIGIGMMILGFILFISVFFSFASFMNNPFLGGRSPSFINSVLGMILMIAGSIVMNIGAKGAAGSGLLLDLTRQERT